LSVLYGPSPDVPVGGTHQPQPIKIEQRRPSFPCTSSGLSYSHILLTTGFAGPSGTLLLLVG
jgi:hypothetical protein